jgi:proline dehydrogenase
LSTQNPELVAPSEPAAAAAPVSVPPTAGGSRLSFLDSALRRLILGSTNSRRLRRFVGAYGMRLGAARFVAAETLDDAVPVLRRLNDRGLAANTTLLGEDVASLEQAEVVAREYVRILDRIHAEQLCCNLAVKLTHLGLLASEDQAYENLRGVVRHAAELGNSVRIDMEYSAVVDPTLRLFKRLREEGLANVGTVLQAYLYRTERDLEELLPLRPNLRFVKGAYLEPATVAYPRKPEVDAAYVRLVERSLTGGGYTAIATHDERLIEHLLAFAERQEIERDRFEVQMLYGVRPELQLRLAARGYKVLVATPFGPEWFPFLMRRLAERPANIGFFLRNAVRG